MNRTDRLYAIVEELRRSGRRGRTAEWLAGRFEVSTRTVKRDVAALVTAGTRIVSQDGRGGGYQLGDHALPPVSFTSAEVASIFVALSADPELPFAADGSAALSKLLRTMSADQRAEIDRITKSVWVRNRTSGQRSHRWVRATDEALRRGVALTIDYEDRTARKTRSRRIDPLALARTGGRWYVLAWCYARQAGRWFRFDRIRRATLTSVPVVQRQLLEVFGPPPEDAAPIG